MVVVVVVVVKVVILKVFNENRKVIVINDILLHY